MTLIERLASATGPNRELDLDIALAVGLISNPVERGCWVDPGECIDGDREPGSGTFVAPAFTASIDAALTLVPEGWETAIYLGGENTFVQMETEAMRSGVFFEPIEGTAPTPALAICIAALKAQET